jgi:hypothetical protein
MRVEERGAVLQAVRDRLRVAARDKAVVVRRAELAGPIAETIVGLRRRCRSRGDRSLGAALM